MHIVSGGSGIKPILRGVATLNNSSSLSVTVPAVNLLKAELSFTQRTFVSGVGSSDLSALSCSGKLNSGTEILFQRGSSVGQCYIEWSIKEYV